MRLFFVHIPKTGGNSIAAAYKNQDVEIWGHNMKIPGYKTYPNSKWGKYFRKIPGSSYVFQSFCITRNPWSRVFSAYNYLKQGGIGYDDQQDFDNYVRPYGDFISFVLNGLDKAMLEQVHFKPQTHWITDSNGTVVVDHVLSLEKIDQQLNNLMESLGKTVVPLPVKNRSSDENYQNHFTPEAADVVAELYSTEIELFNYRFFDA